MGVIGIIGIFTNNVNLSSKKGPSGTIKNIVFNRAFGPRA